MDLLIVGGWVLCAFFTYNQAKKKNFNVGLWTALGLLFGIFGVIASLMVSSKNGSSSTPTGTRGNVGSGATSSAVTGGAAGAVAGMSASQMAAMKRAQESTKEFIEEQKAEEEEPEFDAGDMDF